MQRILQAHLSHNGTRSSLSTNASTLTVGQFSKGAGTKHENLCPHTSGGCALVRMSLAKLDDMQKSFLHQLHLTEAVGFLDFNFAPPCLRRDIGMLGFLHKRVLGQCHVAIQRLLPFIDPAPLWHNKQLDTHMLECVARPILFNRSLFGMVAVYNRLSQEMVDFDSVQKFQTNLTRLAKVKCAAGSSRWQQMFRSSGAWNLA